MGIRIDASWPNFDSDGPIVSISKHTLADQLAQPIFSFVAFQVDLDAFQDSAQEVLDRLLSGSLPLMKVKVNHAVWIGRFFVGTATEFDNVMFVYI